MDYSTVTELITEPAASASVVLGVIWYLRRQSRDNFFRFWLIGWTLYLAFFALIAWRYLYSEGPWKNLTSHLILSAVVYCIFLATRSFKRTIHWNWRYAYIPAGLIAWSIFCVTVIDARRWVPWDSPHFSEVEVAPAAVLAYAAVMKIIFCLCRFLLERQCDRVAQTLQAMNQVSREMVLVELV